VLHDILFGGSSRCYILVSKVATGLPVMPTLRLRGFLPPRARLRQITPRHFTLSKKDRQHEKFIFGKTEGKRQLERHRRRWEDNIKQAVKRLGCVGVYRIHLNQDKES
jgi:hypothetical protein